MITYRIGEGTLTVYADGSCSLCGAAAQPLAHIICGEQCIPAGRAAIHDDGTAIRLEFGQTAVEVKVCEKRTYSVLSAEPCDDRVEALIWGPFYTDYPGECGEVVGIARNQGKVIGIQGLNPKTIGGFPREYVPGHPMAERILDRRGQREPISACAALPLTDGAALQAYCRNRTKTAHRDYFYAKKALVLPVKGEEAVIGGSAIALFACQEEKALEVIGSLEIAEGLPHTLVDGEWSKTAKRANASYLITDFTPESFDEALDCAEEGGFHCVYHPGLFRNWGHFEVDMDGGEAALKTLVERAAQRGIDVGVHTLSNFITTNDPYVTPYPHPHLLKMGETELAEDVDAATTEIRISQDDFFARLSTLNAVRIGDELIHYRRLRREEEKIYLTECQRGAWGTIAAGHRAGDSTARLWDYDYRTLFPDLELQREMSRRLGELFRNTGLKRLSFDGLSGDYTGHEELGNALLVKDCYDIWGPEVISDASGLTHYNWHMHSYMNWGEPWYADMRNGMFEYRRSNQEYFHRNLFPAMMGWYTLRLATRKYESTTPDDIHWMLSKAAGFQAGFAWNADQEAIRRHGKSHEYLKIIHRWETMRLYGDIPEPLRRELRDPKTEWDIETVPGGFQVYRMHIAAFECSPEGAQPGMPAGADWMTYNPHGSQKMVFRLRAGDERDQGCIRDLTFRAGEDFLSFRVQVECGQYFVYEGGTTAVLYDKNFNQLAVVQGDGSPLILEQGIGMLLFKCCFEGEEPPYPQVKLFMRGEPVFVPCTWMERKQ